jgi:2-oxoglutarate/2-oxoacid ferredoxin oxidoreductase subunit beta
MVANIQTSPLEVVHPLDHLIRTDRIPHIWCTGCGIGTVFSSCLKAMISSGIDLEKTCMVSGIGCTGRGAGYLNLDSFHTTHGRAIPFATGMKLANPKLNIIVFSGDGDLFAIGGNHFIHGARRNVDMTVICVNNLIYGMTGGQVAATTPLNAKTTTTQVGNPDAPFNLPLLAWASGANYVARWTMLHIRELTACIEKALTRSGFNFIEVLAPCPTNYGRKNREKSLETLRMYRDKTVIKNNADPSELDVDFEKGIVLGEFVSRERSTCIENYDRTCRIS